MNTEQERAEFEAWREERYGEPAGEFKSNGFCDNHEVQAEWRGWPARAALQAQDAEDAERLDKLMQLADRYAIAVRDNWQPRKHRRALLDHARRVEGN